jgi:hypothetical protein
MATPFTLFFSTLNAHAIQFKPFIFNELSQSHQFSSLSSHEGGEQN